MLGRLLAALAAIAGPLLAFPANASDFVEPWKRDDRALVVDAYEYNRIDLTAIATDPRIAGFIGKASDGVSPVYFCRNEPDYRLCRALWYRHAVARELYHTRRALAKALGLKWGAYHLARPGNPVDQAEHFLDFTQPEPDDLLALDIEENDPDTFMSLDDAEIFARHVHRRIGRYPILYTNHNTAKYIADNRNSYPVLSRLPLWYARYRPGIDGVFPLGNWKRYTLWQFAAQANCDARRCPYRPPGTGFDIDVNVAAMSVDELKAAWPFDPELPYAETFIARVPLPATRLDAGLGEIRFADVMIAPEGRRLSAQYRAGGERYPDRGVKALADAAGLDPVTTGTTLD